MTKNQVLKQENLSKFEFSVIHRQDKPPVVFNIVVPGVGLELPSFGDISPA